MKHKITLKMTCSVCPEQYKAFAEDGRQVGYLRLRHGVFTVNCPDVEGVLVYQDVPEGDGQFMRHERVKFLVTAKRKISEWIDLSNKGEV